MSELYTGVNKFGTASVNFDNNLTIPTLSSTQSIKFESPSQSQEVENVDLLSADDENSNSISNMFAKLYETYNNLDEEEIQILTEGYTTLANAMSNPLDNLSQLASDGWEYATGVLGRSWECALGVFDTLGQIGSSAVNMGGEALGALQQGISSFTADPLSAIESGWNAIQDTGAQVINTAQDGWTSFTEYIGGIGDDLIHGDFEGVLDSLATGAATIEMGAMGFRNGVFNVVEDLLDFGLGMQALGYGTGIGGVIDTLSYMFTGEKVGAVDAVWNGVRDITSIPITDNIFEFLFTETPLSVINEHAADWMQFGSSGYGVSKGVGYVTGTILISLLPVGAAASGTSKLATAGQVVSKHGTMITLATGTSRGATQAWNSNTVTIKLDENNDYDLNFENSELDALENLTVGETYSKQIETTDEKGNIVTQAIDFVKNKDGTFSAKINGESFNVEIDKVSMGEGLTYGAMNGLWEAVQWRLGSKVAGNSVLAIGTDAATGAIDVPLKSLLQGIYSESSFEERFEANGGSSAVISNATLAGTLSSIGELPAFKHFFGNDNNMSTKVDNNADVKLNASETIDTQLQRLKELLADDDIAQEFGTTSYARRLDEPTPKWNEIREAENLYQSIVDSDMSKALSELDKTGSISYNRLQELDPSLANRYNEAEFNEIANIYENYGKEAFPETNLESTIQEYQQYNYSSTEYDNWAQNYRQQMDSISQMLKGNDYQQQQAIKTLLNNEDFANYINNVSEGSNAVRNFEYDSFKTQIDSILSSNGSNLTTANVVEIDDALKQMELAYPGQSLNYLEAAVSNQNYSYITRNGGARSIIEKYSFDQLNDYLNIFKASDTNIQNVVTQNMPLHINSMTDAAIITGDAKQYLYARLSAEAKHNPQLLSELDDLRQNTVYWKTNGVNNTFSASSLYDEQKLLDLGKKYLDNRDISEYYQVKKNGSTLYETPHEFSEHDKEVVFAQTRHSGSQLNSWLRHDVSTEEVVQHLDRISKKYNLPELTIEDIITTYDQIIEDSTLKQPIVTYSGIRDVYSNGELMNVADLEPGMMLQDPGYRSSSLVMGQEYNQPVKLEITSPAGTHAAYIESYTGVSNYHLQEVIHPRNSILEITGYPRNENGYVIIPCTVVEP